MQQLEDLSKLIREKDNEIEGLGLKLREREEENRSLHTQMHEVREECAKLNAFGDSSSEACPDLYDSRDAANGGLVVNRKQASYWAYLRSDRLLVCGSYFDSILPTRRKYA